VISDGEGPLSYMMQNKDYLKKKEKVINFLVCREMLFHVMAQCLNICHTSIIQSILNGFQCALILSIILSTILHEKNEFVFIHPRML